MRTARARRAATFLFSSLILGCTSPGPGRPVVGVAYPSWSRPFIVEAESTLREEWGDTATLPWFVWDSLGGPESADRSVIWTQELLRIPGLAVVVGPSASHTALAVAPAVNAVSIPEIIPTATSRQLDQVGPWTFRLVANDSVEAEFLVHQIAARRSFRSVLLLFVNDAYGQGLRSALRDALGRAGIVRTGELSVSRESDFDALFRNEFARRPPDAILGAFRNSELAPAALSLIRLRSRIPVFVSDGAFGPAELHEVAPRLPFDVFGVAFWLPTPGDTTALRFQRRFYRLYGRRPRPEDMMIHDALVLAATATRATGGDPRALRYWLLSLGASRPPYRGVAGPIDLRAPNLRPFHLARFTGDSAVRAELP